MDAFMVLPFAVFMVCGVVGVWLCEKVRSRLALKYPDRLRAVERGFIWPANARWSIVMEHDYSDLKDPVIDGDIRALRRWYRVATIAALAFAFAIFTKAIPIIAGILDVLV